MKYSYLEEVPEVIEHLFVEVDDGWVFDDDDGEGDDGLVDEDEVRGYDFDGGHFRFLGKEFDLHPYVCFLFSVFSGFWGVRVDGATLVYDFGSSFGPGLKYLRV